MTVDIVIPALGESITEGTILRWIKNAGEAVERDEIVVEIETDKATMELAAPETGVLSEILKGEGEKVLIGDVIARVTPGAQAPRAAGQPVTSVAPPPAAPVRLGSPATSASAEASAPLSPAVRRLVEEHASVRQKLRPQVAGEESRKEMSCNISNLKPVGSKLLPDRNPQRPFRVAQHLLPQPVSLARTAGTVPRERIEPMSRIRRRIAERLKQVQNTAAILTTFNEIDMSAAIALRREI